MTNELKPWGKPEKEQWFKEQVIKRSYFDDVVTKIKKLEDEYEDEYKVEQYGTLNYDDKEYPLFLILSPEFSKNKKTILITGGVHGYETSGVHGAIAFVERELKNYIEYFNFVVTPCISPWGYETINRWNPDAIDPNRSFFEDSPSKECALVMKAVKSLDEDIYAHFDLHETTDTDNTIFRPALEKRDGVIQEIWDIPDGFYLVGDSENPVSGFQEAIIENVKNVTHIAPADSQGKIIGEPVVSEGVIHYPIKSLNLCASFSDAELCTTTEVYPDSPKVNDEDCINAQVFAICGGLEYIKSLESS